jgi:uncharacterized protein
MQEFCSFLVHPKSKRAFLIYFSEIFRYFIVSLLEEVIMHIHLEKSESTSIQAYSENSITIDNISYCKSLIVSSTTIQPDWPVKDIQELAIEKLSPILDLKPKIIIIGYKKTKVSSPMNLISDLSQLGIGIEFMSIGAACRTFNVLLSEHREVVLGVIL